MKVHPILAENVVVALYNIFSDNRKADKVLQQLLRSNPRWGSRDRGFIAENTYEIVRWYRLLHFLNGSPIEDHTPVTLWRLLGIRLKMMGFELPEMKEFKGINIQKINERMIEANKIRKIKESIPDWLDEVGEQELGDKWPEYIHSLNKPAPIGIRANTLKISRKELIQVMKAENVDAVLAKGVEDGLIIFERKNIFTTNAFKSGLFEVQDIGSQMIGEFLEITPGMRIIDACAGAGGKSLHLACRMENKGRIISMDVEEWKLTELKRRAARDDAHNIETRLIEAKTIKRLKDSADAVLLDVPCTGLGVLRRNPDAKWKIRPEFLDEVKKEQAEILSRYASMVKPSGQLVYATCSILPSENEYQVTKFLEANKEFTLVKEKRTHPATENCDGFYMALMKRTNSSPNAPLNEAD